MRKKITIIIFTVIMGFNAFSEPNSGIDSLLGLVEKSAGQKKIELYNQLSEEYLSVDLSKSVTYASKALDLAKKGSDQYDIAISVKNLGKAYLYSGENEKAYQNLIKAQEIFERLEDNEALPDVFYSIGLLYQYESSYDQALGYFKKAMELLTNEEASEQEAALNQSIGTIYFYRSEFDSAVYYYEKSLETKKELGQKEEMANAYNNIGLVNYYWGNYDRALENYFAALDIFKLINNDEGTAHCLFGIGNVYNKTEDYKKALNHYQKAVDIYEKIGNRKRLANTLNSIGIVYKAQENYEKAIEYQKKSLEIKKEIGNKKGIAASLNGLGISYKKTERYPEALEYYQQALEIQLEIGDIVGAGSTYSNIGMLYTAWEKYTEAIVYYEKADEFAQRSKYTELIMNNYEGMAENFEKLGQYEKAFKYYVLFSSVKDSVFTARKQEQLSELQTKYETKEAQQAVLNLTKENEIKQLVLDKKQNQNIGLLLLSALIVIIAILIIRQIKIVNKQKSMELEQKLLRSQMNPHFIFNSLIAIQSFIYQKNDHDAGKFLADFSKLMRLILENSREEFITLDKEIESLGYYLSLQKLRFENRFDYEINVDKEIETEFIEVPPMLLQPFVENSVEHGMKEKDKDGHIEIKIKQSNGMLNIVLTDNGIGRSRSADLKDKNHRSYGTQITGERLGLLKKKTGVSVRYEIQDLFNEKNQPGGTSVRFDIPVKM